MSVARLVLLRHGATTDPEVCAGRRGDPGLSAQGRAQAADAAERLGRDFARVVASPSRRARETAAAFGLAVDVDARLAERDFGEWEGRPWAQLWAQAPEQALADPAGYAAFAPPGAEKAAEVADRMWEAVVEYADPAAEPVLLVTHSGPLRLAVARALGLDEQGAFRLLAEPGRAARLAVWDRAWTLEALNA